MDRFRVQEPFRLADHDPASTLGMDEAECAAKLEANRTRIARLQNVLYAEQQRALLVILQSMDTGGKDPIIRDVLYTINAQASRVTAFKRESKSEAQRDRLLRFHNAVPAKGELGVFNRSYYDDVIARHAHDELSAEELPSLYRQMNEFEYMLADSHVTLIKLYLHLSKDEQRRRLKARLDDPDRHWELSEADFEERRYWDGYMRAYEHAIRNSNTEWGPWYLITADKSWFRDYAASEIIVYALERMDPKYPPASFDLSKARLD